MQVQITRHTSANKQSVFEGDVLTVSDHEARVLIGYNAAVVHDSEEAEASVPKRDRKPKPPNIEGE